MQVFSDALRSARLLRLHMLGTGQQIRCGGYRVPTLRSGHVPSARKEQATLTNCDDTTNTMEEKQKCCNRGEDIAADRL